MDSAIKLIKKLITKLIPNIRVRKLRVSVRHSIKQAHWSCSTRRDDSVKFCTLESHSPERSVPVTRAKEIKVLFESEIIVFT